MEGVRQAHINRDGAGAGGIDYFRQTDWLTFGEKFGVLFCSFNCKNLKMASAVMRCVTPTRLA